MSFKPLIIAALFMPASLLAAPADCPPTTATALDLAGVVSQALCRHPDSRSAWLAIQSQQSRLASAKSSYYPTLDAQVGQTHSFGAVGSADTTSARLSANWLLYDFGSRSANKTQAEQLLKAVEATQEATTQRIVQQAVDAYYAWYAADAALTAAKASEEAAQETLRAAETRQRVGAGTQAEVLQARTAFAQAQLSVIQRDGTRETARGAVAIAIGLPPPGSIVLTPPPSTLPSDLQPPAFEGLADTLSDNRPDLRAQKLTVEATKASRNATYAQDRPTLSLSANDGVSRTQGSGTGFRESGTVGLSLSIPLVAGGRYRAQEAIANQQVEQAELDYERLALNARNDLWTAWQSVRTSAASVNASQSVVASAGEAHRAALARYKAGLGSLIDVLNAQSTLADARQQEASTRYNWWRARLALARTSGILNAAMIESGMNP